MNFTALKKIELIEKSNKYVYTLIKFFIPTYLGTYMLQHITSLSFNPSTLTCPIRPRKIQRCISLRPLRSIFTRKTKQLSLSDNAHTPKLHIHLHLHQLYVQYNSYCGPFLPPSLLILQSTEPKTPTPIPTTVPPPTIEPTARSNTT